MTPVPAFPGGYAIFCDDVRTEATGKETIIGSYNGEMVIVGEAPTKVLQLCAFIRFYDDPETFPKYINFKITRTAKGATEVLSSGGTEIPNLPKAPTEPDDENDGQKYVMVGLTVKMENVEFTEECRLRVLAEVDGKEIWLGALGVKISPPTPPSEE